MAKKLMVLLAAVALAGAAQAYSCILMNSMSVSGMHSYGGTSSDEGQGAYYLYSGSATLYIVSGGKVATQDFTISAGNYSGSPTWFGVTGFTDSAFSAYFTATDTSGAEYKSTVYEGTFEIDPDDDTWATANNVSFTSGSWTASGGGSAVPEPTSGLLLLVGGALLALRRKRA